MTTTSSAILAQGTRFGIAGAAGTPISVTAITKSKPAVATGTNTLAVGDTVVFGAIVGMPEILNRVGIVSASSGTTFTVNIDSTNFATVGTTGTATPQTFVDVNNVHDYSGFDGVSSEIDITNLQSLAKEYAPGLEDYGQFTMNVDVDNTDPGQIAMRGAKSSQLRTYFRLIMRNASVRVFYGFVKKQGEAAAVDGVVKTAVDIRISGRPSFSELVN